MTSPAMPSFMHARPVTERRCAGGTKDSSGSSAASMTSCTAPWMDAAAFRSSCARCRASHFGSSVTCARRTRSPMSSRDSTFSNRNSSASQLARNSSARFSIALNVSDTEKASCTSFSLELSVSICSRYDDDWGSASYTCRGGSQDTASQQNTGAACPIDDSGVSTAHKVHAGRGPPATVSELRRLGHPGAHSLSAGMGTTHTADHL